MEESRERQRVKEVQETYMSARDPRRYQTHLCVSPRGFENVSKLSHSVDWRVRRFGRKGRKFSLANRDNQRTSSQSQFHLCFVLSYNTFLELLQGRVALEELIESLVCSTIQGLIGNFT